MPNRRIWPYVKQGAVAAVGVIRAPVASRR
jgi:hypothetical protein